MTWKRENMDYYFAPMEGITGPIYRNAFQAFFPGIHKYFTAFIAPNQKGKFSAREKKDIAPENNRGIHLVPQIMTNDGQDFIFTACQLAGLGYKEVNLNLGCPSKTVVSKYRGSGFLAKPDMLERFLEEIFKGRDRQMPDVKISIKTRIGRDGPEEFVRLLNIYNQYPLEELIIHPRTQRDFYQGTPRMEVFRYAEERANSTVCYNGDILTVQDVCMFARDFPEVTKIMIGRGFLRDPGLLFQLQGKRKPGKEVLRAFHDEIYKGYLEEMPGAKPVLFKMKELWAYMGQIFPDGKKPLKQIRKAEKLEAYEAGVEALFAECRESAG